MATKLQDLETAARVAVKDARDIAEKAGGEGRSLTDDERANYTQSMTKGRELLEQIRTAKADEQIIADAKSLATEIGPLSTGDLDATLRNEWGDPRSNGRKTLGEFITNSAEFKALLAQFKGHVPDKGLIQSDPIQVKSLFTGVSDTSGGAFVVAEQTGIVEMLGRRQLVLRDLLSLRRTGSDTVEYVSQTSHTNNAATVAEATSSAAPTTGASSGAALTLNAGGGYKPEGAWAFARQTAVVKTIAEWVPATRRALSDVAALEGLINDELRADIAEAEETQILSGDGVGENLTGVATVSGTQTQAFSTDIIVTARKAITKAQVVGRVNPTAFVFSPGDVEKIDLIRDTTGQYLGGGPFRPAQSTLWGRPYLASEALADGVGWLADWKKAVLWDREQTTVTMSNSHADFFTRNLVAILAEERVAFAVTRPSAFVKVTTA